MKTQPEAAGVSPTQDSRGNEELHEEEEDYRAGKADGPSGTHTHQWQPLILMLTVKVHDRYPWGNHVKGAQGLSTFI